MKTQTLTPWLYSAAIALSSISLTAQYNERPDILGSGSAACDASGRSIKNMRTRAIHTTDPTLQGGTAYLFERDPFLAYQLGRNLNFREYRVRDGVFDLNIANLAGPMPDGTTAKITANNQTSCVGCHNLPQGNPGGGPNFHKDSGFGRNTPHYFGSGIVEMLALQVRAELKLRLDRDRNGYVDASEAQQAGKRATIETSKGQRISYGNPRLSHGKTGSPEFNNIINVWYVDKSGKHVPGATKVDGQKTFGYDFALIVWGWGQGVGRSALNPTNRTFLWDPFKAHTGLESHDPTTMDDPDGNGVSVPSLAGAPQFPVSHKTPDQGNNLDPLGFSRDDGDKDGYLNEISEGDLDLGEWFMLNAPRPAFAGTHGEYQRGVKVMERLGCTDCHTSDWVIKGKDAIFSGDRRLFDLDVKWNQKQQRLEGELKPLYTLQNGQYIRKQGKTEVRGLFSDLRHHDMGKGFAELDFGGTVNTTFRTPMLWGVGSGFPWGHDGKSLTIEDVIARHGGEASDSARAWKRAPRKLRKQLVSFLQDLVLYDIESLPADIDGDGKIAKHFMVAGMDTGIERFNAEWLFLNPLRIQGAFQNNEGKMIKSFAGVNIRSAYGMDLALRKDSDADGWPDLWDHAPGLPGYRDGVR